MSDSYKAFRAASILIPAALLTTSAAFAQSSSGAAPTKSRVDTGETPTGSLLEEIVVTAQKRGENLQRVPIAISVVSSEGLTAAGIKNIGEIKVALPALSTANTIGFLNAYLRGVGSQGNGIGFENPVALYVDGVYVANQMVGLFSFNNIAQVEVDKGPQGTLFGRNATGGLIQITTLEPTEDSHMKTSLGASSYGGVDASIYAARPIAPNLAADISVSASRRDGWGENLFNGKDVYAVPHDVNARSKWIYKPGDWKITLIGDYADTVSSNNAVSAVQGSRTGDGTGPIGNPIFYPNSWDTNTNIQPRLTISDGGVSLKIERDMGSVQVSNLAAWRFTEFRSIADYDATPAAGTGLNLHRRDWQVSDEVQFASSGSGPLKWVGGVYYFLARGYLLPDGISIGGVVTPASSTIPFFTVANSGQQTTEAEAIFSQVSYELLPTLNLTLGARYSLEQRNASGDSSVLNCTLPSAFCPPSVLVPPVRQSTHFNKPTFRAAIDYQVTQDALLYASVNTGFKSGGYNSTSPGTAAYDPETITAYETGAKADLFDRKLRVNSAVFYYDYQDMQSMVAGTFSTNFTNGGSAHLYGLDADITAFPLGDLQLTASAALLHAKYYTFLNALIGQAGGGFPVISGDATGNTLPHAPKTTLTLGATYPFDFAGGKLTLSGKVYHNSGYFMEPDNIIRQNAYTTVGASLRWVSPDERFSLLFYGNNLSDKAVKSMGFTTPDGDQWTVMDAPRTIGATVTYEY